jgi:2-polyprenyl-3-methyl-5-hydroxy-6-metoxy-1,4-benzoquinol methylase
MNIQSSYNLWAGTYDQCENKTRDLELSAQKSFFSNTKFETILELGCGTGKNSQFLHSICKHLTAVDFSEKMILKAMAKFKDIDIDFLIRDINQEWSYPKKFDLITSSLILEHIQNLDHIFLQANQVLNANGLFYIGELHPFKQYLGSQANFKFNNTNIKIPAFVHHLSDYFRVAEENYFKCIYITETFDDPISENIPRILTLVFQKHSDLS